MNVFLGLCVMGLCLLQQSILLVFALRFYARHEKSVKRHTFISNLLVVNGVMVIMVFGNLTQIAIWAALFVFLGEFTSFFEAFYHSAVNFSTLGYGDLVMSPAHRLLGPLEAVNGVLMIGASTASLMAAFQSLIKNTKQPQKK